MVYATQGAYHSISDSAMVKWIGLGHAAYSYIYRYTCPGEGRGKCTPGMVIGGQWWRGEKVLEITLTYIPSRVVPGEPLPVKNRQFFPWFAPYPATDSPWHWRDPVRKLPGGSVDTRGERKPEKKRQSFRTLNVRTRRRYCI